MKKIIVVIRIDAGLINLNPETVEDALNRYFASDGAVSVFYAEQQPFERDVASGCPWCHRLVGEGHAADCDLAHPQS